MSWQRATRQTKRGQGTAYLNTAEHKRGIIAGYYAMIAEYDDMVGAYVAALAERGLQDSTVLILTSDHGDMQMQHQQARPSPAQPSPAQPSRRHPTTTVTRGAAVLDSE